MSAAPPLVRLRGVRRSFGPVRALDGAELTLRPGEVHAVLGENGAGKTTLLGVLAGLVQPDGGTVEVRGHPRSIRSPSDAWALGVGMVHQHFALVPRLTALENLALGGRRGGRGLRLQLGSLLRRARELSRETGLEVDLRAPVESLGVGARQRVEILKVLLRDPEILVLDEPTAVLAPPEVERLLAILRRLAGEGRAVVLVAHKLDEVLAVADRVTVLRRGRTVLEASRSEVDAPGLARSMVGTAGRELVDEVLHPPSRNRRGGPGGAGGVAAAPAPPGETVAVLRGVEVAGARGEPALRGVDLELRRGEIVGVAGVTGNGQRELARILAGRLVPDRGEATIPPDPGFVPRDRRGEGLVGDFDLTENVALRLHRDPALRRGPFVRWGALRERTRVLLERYDVRAPGPGTPAERLSGGNQQRVVVARELATGPALLVVENPTRGLDVAAAAFVHRALLELAGSGRPPAIALVSTDLDEVLALADRLFVLVRGVLEAVPLDDRSREAVGARMLAGVAAEGGRADPGSAAGRRRESP